MHHIERDRAGRFTSANTALRNALAARKYDPIVPRTTSAEPAMADANNLLRSLVASAGDKSAAVRRAMLPQPVVTDTAALAAEVRDLTDLLRTALYGESTTDAEEAN